MTTVARTNSPDGSHWYACDGTPMYSVIAKSTSQPRPTTLADARKLNLLPSVTTILKILHKQALVDWLIEQACLAVLTTPRPAEEPLDAFVERILHTEKVQDQEAQAARELGTDMHNGLESLSKGEQIDEELRPWIEPAYKHLREICPRVIAVESIVCGSGYAGKIDFIGDASTHELVVDFKTSKKLPEKSSWHEHRLQLAAYANARKNGTPRFIKTANLYISTVDQGKYAYFENIPWQADYENGFAPLVKHWQWSTGYHPASEP